MKKRNTIVLILYLFIHSFQFSCINADLSAINNDFNGHEEECESHKSCSECASSYVYCHWCSSDETCHSTKNWIQHSCVIGTECAEVCTRSQPEYLYGHLNNTNTDASSSIVVKDEHHGNKSRIWMIIVIGLVSFGSILSCSFRSKEFAVKSLRDSIDMDIHDLKLEEVDEFQNEIELSTKTNQNSQNQFSIDDDDDCTNDINHSNKQTKQYEQISNSNYDGPKKLSQEYAKKSTFDSLNALFHQSKQSILKYVSDHHNVRITAHRVFILMSAGLFTALIVTILIYFPKTPQVNICSTMVGWTKIFENLLQVNMEAPFDLLISVKNTNKLNVNFDLGLGSIKYQGIEFGTFEVDSMTLPANSINDDFVSVTFSIMNLQTANALHPLEIMEEMINGNLKFTVDAVMYISFPDIWGLSYKKKWNAYTVDFEQEVTDLIASQTTDSHGRELCLCKFK